MHIAIIDSICDPAQPGVGGLSDINWRLAHELVNAGDVVTIIGPYHKDVAVPYPNIQVIEVPKAVIRNNNIIKSVLRTVRLAHAAKQLHRVDVYHVPDSITAGFVSLWGLGSRVVWHGHTNVYYYSRNGIPYDMSTYILMLAATKYASQKVSHVVTLGPSMIPWWQKSGFSRDRIRVIPNAVDMPTSDSRDEAAKWDEVAIAWKKNTYHLLYVGRLAPDKGGQLELIDAIAKLHAEIPVGLAIAGDGPLRNQIEKTIQNRNLTNVVTCVGHQPPEILSYAYRGADLVVLPSQAEMLPRVMLEAWAAGAPFMANAVGAIPDYLKDGDNGYLLNSLQPDYLRLRLRDVLRDPVQRAQVATRGKAFAQEMSWPRMATEFREIYHTVVANSRRR